MGEYEPNDSRNVTLTNNTAPGEPPRTGPREEKTRYENEEKVAQRAADHAAGGPDPNAPPGAGSSEAEAGWAADFSPEQAERARQQPADPPAGLGYGAQGGEQMKDAPDLTQRGYGGASQQRQDKIEGKN